ncbi:DUF551 domain-containing protein [Achromobacter deleyi]|uniref:DUF551 domain-containing protein n=1 Tax=Achromobacter deleyi TaxID=1353891 RepID=A0A7T4B961_9BURK|nr:DUF551 domain-containing protein [Achromobacter deleyi]QQB37949.1 DUF551 domain-containing protein [Achromobacter deleyi]
MTTDNETLPDTSPAAVLAMTRNLRTNGYELAARMMEALGNADPAGWLPIESAPKDGRRVLLWNERYNAAITGQFYGLGGWKLDGEMPPLFHQPTHWMPLPAPPCPTCNDQGAVGNILTAEPCPACAAPGAPASTVATEGEKDERQALFWFRPCSDGGHEGPIHNDRIEDVRKQSGAWVPLYPGFAALPKPLSDLRYHGEFIRGWNQCLREVSASVAAPAAGDALTAAASDVLAERQRQRQQEGWTDERDDEYDLGELASAAAAYARYAALQTATDDPHPLRRPLVDLWPWDAAWWKPGAARRNLEKAGALILAEIERLDRAAIAAQRKGGA